MTTPAPTTLSPEQSALLWDALNTHLHDPRFAHEQDETRYLRDLLTGSDVTVTPRT